MIFANVKRVYSVQEMENMRNLPEGSWVVLDVDDHLITPKDQAFRYIEGKESYRNMFDELKAQYKAGAIEQAEFEHILGNWRLAREVIVLDPEWRDLFKYWHAKGVKVLALTTINTGTFGPIESVERWRYQELKDLGLEFSDPAASGDTVIELARGRASYYRGIIINAGISKAELLGQLMDTKLLGEAPSYVVFSDDREKNATSIAQMLAERNIEHSSYCFRGIERLDSSNWDEALCAYQKNYLFEHYVWLSDAEARERMSAGAL